MYTLSLEFVYCCLFHLVEKNFCFFFFSFIPGLWLIEDNVISLNLSLTGLKIKFGPSIAISDIIFMQLLQNDMQSLMEEKWRISLLASLIKLTDLHINMLMKCTFIWFEFEFHGNHWSFDVEIFALNHRTQRSH